MWLVRIGTPTLKLALATLALATLAGCGNSLGNSNNHGQQIRLFTPDSDSGTFDFFLEALELEGQRKDVQASSDDNTLITGVAGDADALGYLGFAYYSEHSERLRAVPIQAGPNSEPVAPSLETIYSGTYAPLSRPLFIYVKHEAMKRPEVARFVTFYLQNIERLAFEGGYVPPTERERAENLATLERLKRAVGPPTEPDRPVVVDGSSTVYPISASAQEAYDDATPGRSPKIVVDLHGTGGGFGRYVQGEVDIVDASRPARPKEEQAALERGYDWTRFVVGHDGITVVVHSQNDFVDKLTIEQLRLLFQPESPIHTWKDLDPSWPSSALMAASAGSD
ncbi:hypothetical protein BH23PLA1_BH23PLA1_13200 [soil metagenome]